MKTFLCGLILILTLPISVSAEVFNVSKGIAFNKYLILSERSSNLDKTLTSDDHDNVFNGNGFILGFLHTADYERKVVRNESVFILPDTITVGQIILIMQKYLKQHPERLHEDTIVLLYKALTEAYPNPKYKPKP